MKARGWGCYLRPVVPDTGERVAERMEDQELALTPR